MRNPSVSPDPYPWAPEHQTILSSRVIKCSLKLQPACPVGVSPGDLPHPGSPGKQQPRGHGALLLCAHQGQSMLSEWKCMQMLSPVLLACLQGSQCYLARAWCSHSREFLILFFFFFLLLRLLSAALIQVLFGARKDEILYRYFFKSCFSGSLLQACFW